MKRRFAAILAVTGFSLQLASLALASDRVRDRPVFRSTAAASEGKSDKASEEKVEKTGKTDKVEQSAQPAEQAKAEDKAPRAPASSQEIISSETVEYMKDAGKKVERIFEPIGRR